MMLAVQGYFDGTAIRPLEKITAKPNQRVIIAVMDEFVELEGTQREKGMHGILAQCAGPALAERENLGAFHVQPQRIGFLKGNIRVPDDFDSMGQEEIEGMFGDFQ